MITKDSLQDLVIEALKNLGGEGRPLDVSKYVGDNYESDLKHSGDLFYTWQYDIRWAAQKLRNRGILAPLFNGRGPWRLNV